MVFTLKACFCCFRLLAVATVLVVVDGGGGGGGLTIRLLLLVMVAVVMVMGLAALKLTENYKRFKAKKVQPVE